MQGPRTPVLIVGAGPTGLTLACDLARRGVAHRIVDREPNPPRASRAKGIQPRTLEVFDDLGIAHAIRSAGGDYPPFRVHVGALAFFGGRMNRIARPTPEVPYPNLWMLPQWRVEEILRARLEALGGCVERAALTALEQDASYVHATLDTDAGAERVAADYVVGADGGHSAVRALTNIELHGESLRESPAAILADVEIDGLARDAWHVWPLARGCLMTLCPLPGTNVFQMAAPIRRKATPPELTEEGIRAFVARAVGLTVGAVGWISNYRPHVRIADRFRVGRVFIAGDAAHIHPPSGGQGLNTGVQDAYNLGWKIAYALRGASDDLLDTYEAERRPIAAAVLGLSKRLYGKPSTKRGRETQQLDLHYRGSALSRDERAKRGALSAGDRAPDGICEDASGNVRRLFDMFRGPHFTKLIFGDDGASATREDVRVVRLVRSPGAGDALVDRDGRVHRSYGASGALCVLVRPDGYIALCAHDVASADAYVAKLTTPR